MKKITIENLLNFKASNYVYKLYNFEDWSSTLCLQVLIENQVLKKCSLKALT